ncbi:putative bifunctional diguanylate cyclase/phosphodiesterase [Kineococcus radiotolerans]|uniref:Diguanylate cyclase/phosphodiesterase n=1 Tax=Kineococcus radiotolerans (strain ATCC BAA-149 / DSM 14245 / SRS30216) TaxID=266940 RepID=A6WEN2_KINRD|nr:EAL domain-containing protein [Kineococcus radiotolerans]ABS05271.1 diguanylate cyclase/phosphodiesterase [Kineococcus radiotolerans SRS30216 = ATCC BAA-149]
MDLAALSPDQLGHASALLEHVLTELSAGTSERDVLTRAATLVADLVDADVVAVCEGAHVHGGVGLGQRFLPERGLARVVRDGGGSFAVPGLGRVRATVVAVPALSGVHLVVGRVEGAAEPGTTLTTTALVARVLGLVVLSRHGRERERWHRQQGARGAAERGRLQQALRQREQVLTTSVRFQRAVSSRRPLPELLLQIAASSSELMDGRAVTLVLADPRSRMEMRVVAAVGEPQLDPGLALAATAALGGFGVAVGDERTPAAAAVHINGRSVGALVLDTLGSGSLDPVGATVLRAFAEHASMALSHADTVRAVEAASSDPLTNLPNRAALLRHLEVALRVTEADGVGTAVLFIDLNGFKQVNDSLGHAAGDEVLSRVARRLRRCLRGDDLAARLGGDEFALVVRDVEPARAAARIAARVQADVAMPLETHGRTVRVGASIGIAVAESGVGAAEMLRRADSAMYRAKAESRTGSPAPSAEATDGSLTGRVVLFEADMHDVDRLRRRLEHDLLSAVTGEEFELVYQPIVRLGDGAVVGAEALLRWRHGTRGLLEPGAFLAGAERSPAVEELWRWVLRTACAQAALWREQVPDLSITVNLSAAHVMTRGVADDVRRALTAASLDPTALVLDVPADLLAEDPDVLVARLRKLRATGARILLDDFATLRPDGGVLAGHSLAPLRQLPVDGVKLDRTLVAEIDGPDGVDALAAVRTLCELGAALDLGVVAEGVERAEQVLLLQEAGCTVGQGVLLGAPRSVEELGSDLAAGELGPVEPGVAVPALADLVELVGAPGAHPEAGGPEPGLPLSAAELFAREFGPVGVAREGAVALPAPPAAGPAGAPGSPVPVPISGVRPTDLRRMLDRSR